MNGGVRLEAAGDRPAAAPGAAEAGATGVPGYPGPYAVGRYAARLRERLRELARVCLIGEATGVRIGAGPNVYFELRDPDRAIPCAMWRTDFDRPAPRADALRDRVQVVAARGCAPYTRCA